MKYATKILQLAESLGAKTDGKNKLHKSLLDAPDFVRGYAESFQWPKSKTYRLIGSGEKLYGPPNADDFDLDSISLHGSIGRADDEFFEGKLVYGIGIVGDGSYVLLFDGNDKKPEDPMVYIIDHELEPDDEMNELFRLQEFLTRLEPD